MIKNFLTTYKVWLIIGLVLVTGAGVSLIHNQVDDALVKRYEEKIAALEASVLRSEGERDSEIAKRDQYKKQADEVLPKIQQAEKSAKKLDAKITSTSNEINKERTNHEAITNSRPSDNSIDLELTRACSGLHKAGLLKPEDPCN